MKTPLTTIAITLIAFTARATDMVPYIAMPVGVGYAIDAKGNRSADALCVRDAVFAPHPQYPSQLRSNIGDSAAWTRYKGDGLYRLDIDLNTGRVSQVTIIKSTGSKILDTANTSTFKLWAFQTGQVERNHHPYHCAHKAGGSYKQGGRMTSCSRC